MSYLEEVEILLKELFYESWMDNEDWASYLKFMEENGISLSKLAEELEIGVNNGFSVETQIKLIKQALSKK